MTVGSTIFILQLSSAFRGLQNLHFHYTALLVWVNMMSQLIIEKVCMESQWHGYFWNDWTFTELEGLTSFPSCKWDSDITESDILLMMMMMMTLKPWYRAVVINTTSKPWFGQLRFVEKPQIDWLIDWFYLYVQQEGWGRNNYHCTVISFGRYPQGWFPCLYGDVYNHCLTCL